MSIQIAIVQLPYAIKQTPIQIYMRNKCELNKNCITFVSLPVDIFGYISVWVCVCESIFSEISHWDFLQNSLVFLSHRFKIFSLNDFSVSSALFSSSHSSVATKYRYDVQCICASLRWAKIFTSSNRIHVHTGAFWAVTFQTLQHIAISSPA